MKTLTTVLFCLFAIAAFADVEPKDGDTKVILMNELTADENFLKVGEVLNELGYRVRKSDPVFKSIESGVIEFKGHRRGTYKQIMMVSVKDGQITLTSWFKRRGKGKDLATYASGDNVEIAFENMEKVAEAVGGSVSYSD